MTTKRRFWAISDFSLEVPIDISTKATKLGKWFVYSGATIEYVDDIGIIVDGYVLPRISCAEEYSNAVDADLVFRAYKKHGSKFIADVKGAFTIIIIDGDAISAFSDRSGLCKWFTYQDGKTTLITTNLRVIANNKNLKISNDNIATYSLMEHYIDATTMFKDITHSKAGAKFELKDKVKESQYWKPETLLSLGKEKYTFEEMAFRFKDIIKGYIDCYSPVSPTMTLTGGNDSRAILAALLSLGTKPRAFTFGNPKSYDGVIAEEISRKVSLEYNCYFRENPTPEWFRSKALEVIEIGDSLLNIHRAHRLDAIQQEIENYKDTDMIFCGFMGGDFIKGINYDDYITSKLFRLKEYENVDLASSITNLTAENFLRSGVYSDRSVLALLDEQFCFSREEKIEREFFYIFNVVGSLHDYQDINIFAKHVPVVVNIYMDVDFLELLFSSQYSMMHKDNSSKNQLKRMSQPELHCNIINILAPSLSSIEFSKHYSPKEFLGNKLVFLAKRIYRNYFGQRYPENFPYGDWFLEFVRAEAKRIPNEVLPLYNIDKYNEALLREADIFMEKQYHKYSNMTNVILNYEYFKNLEKRDVCTSLF